MRLNSKNSHSMGSRITEIELMRQAMYGDIVAVITPGNETPAPTAEAWDNVYTVTLKNANGDVHAWFDGLLDTILSVANTSSAGTATIDGGVTDNTDALQFTDGVATFTVSGDAQDWLNSETVTSTVADMTILGYTVACADPVMTFTTA